jgi:Fic/DOC family
MLGRSGDLHCSGSMPARSRLAYKSPGISYRPKFTITPHLSGLVAHIEATREQFPSLEAPHRDFQDRRGTPGHCELFTLERVLAMANGEDFPVVTESGEQDVLDYYAMRYRRETLSGKGNWTHKEVLHLHKVVTAGEGMDQGRAGEYRSISVRTRGFVPPPPREVPQLMVELLEWWNTRARRLPAVITSAVLHYRISDIHPFSDGNGRFARALALWELYRNGFGHMLSLNGHYWGRRRRYYAALRAVSRRGEDLTRWLEYCAGRLKLELRRAKNNYTSESWANETVERK